MKNSCASDSTLRVVLKKFLIKFATKKYLRYKKIKAAKLPYGTKYQFSGLLLNC